MCCRCAAWCAARVCAFAAPPPPAPCSGNWPGRDNTQVPLEVRCATSPGAALRLDNFSGPEYLFWFYFNRNLPYDPVYPWKDTDGRWYAAISADAWCVRSPLPSRGRCLE